MTSQPARARRIAVLIPALDEEKALPLVLSEIPPGLVDLVVVVDNGSRDRTAAVAREGGALVVREERRGYGQACLAGLEVLLEGAQGVEPLGGEDVIVFLDADYSDHPEEMSDLVGPLLSGGTDLVLGSRMMNEASRKALLPQARVGNRLASILIRILFGVRYTDLGPFRAIRVDALRHLKMADRDFGWTVEMQLKAAVAGLHVREMPVRYRSRIGKSKITGTLAGTVRASQKILAWIIGWRLALLFTARRIPRFRESGRIARR
ncbi:MAG: glycosyltransferase family 2 protein [Planctomycetota bacterium]